MSRTRDQINIAIHYISSGRGDPDEIDRVEIDHADTHVTCFPKRDDEPEAPPDEIGVDGRINYDAARTTDRAAASLLQYFEYEHLPPPLQSVSKPFCELARKLTNIVGPHPERTVALRKLLEAKDAAVRACIPSK